jgi:hypothetical protein
MMELMSQVALEAGAERRREVAQETMRAARAADGGFRHVAGVAVIGIGRRIAGEMPATSRRMQASGDCL